MNSGWGDDFQVFLQRVKLLRQTSVTALVAPSAVEDTQTMGISVDEEAEVAEATHLNSYPEVTATNHSDATVFADSSQEDDDPMMTNDASTLVSAASGGMVKVTVGIDEDLRLILEMDPSIVDLGGQWTHALDRQPARVLGLPPITGG